MPGTRGISTIFGLITGGVSPPSANPNLAMLKCTLPVALVFWINLLCGQSFMATPEPVLTQTLEFNLANECYIYFTNPSGDTLHLRWRLVESNLPDNWVADLCDYGTCYNGIPSNGLMNPVYDTIQPYLKLIVQPGENAGACWIWFRAYENGNQANYADVFFNLHTPGTLATQEPATPTVHIYPNPVSNNLKLENPGGAISGAQIIHLSGTISWTGDIPEKTTLDIPVNHWPPGSYLLKTPKQTKQILIQH